MNAEPRNPAEEVSRHRALRYVGWAAGVIVGLVVLLVAAVALAAAVIPKPAVPSKPNPATSYADAVARIDKLKALDAAEIGWGTEAYLQGSKVATAVVLFHGYTNNPAQFSLIGKAYADAGYNVIIPRIPGHGYKQLINKELSQLNAERLAAVTDQAVDIAAGLGDRVEVVGLSGGGTMASWAAYNRDEVKSVVAMSPFFEPLTLPDWLVRPITQVTRITPDVYLWWDPRLKARRLVPPDAYPRYSLRSLSAVLELGYWIDDNPPTRKTKLDRALFISNASDRSVNESLGYHVFETKIGPISRKLEFYEFARKLGYAHDLIDPNGENAKNIDAIHAELYPLLGLTPPAPR
jgi:pimeloyl-ACP methyl ester carboxylesterase